MKPYLIMATINELSNLKDIVAELEETGTKVIIVDEGNDQMRSANSRILDGLEVAYYGPRERREWFGRFGSRSEEFGSVIPERAHAETSFGFLIAYEEGADYVIELDDDVFASSLVRDHGENLFGDGGITVSAESRWYNTLEAISLTAATAATNMAAADADADTDTDTDTDTDVAVNTDADTAAGLGRGAAGACGLFPRGHPYSPGTRSGRYFWKNEGGRCVLNMGHWTGCPDFDALTILYHGGLNGRCGIEGASLKKGREKVVVDRGTYFAVCSMNTSFLPKVIPAFYQLYMNTMGIDRFDDIWSGILLKRVADHLGERVCLGKPVGLHDKRPRSTFRDLRKELEGMAMNEVFWRIADREISGSTYSDCYLSLADLIEAEAAKMQEASYRSFLRLQVDKMRLWIRILDLM